MKVPSQVKINGEYHVEHILKPLIQILLKFFDGYVSNLFVHHDKISCHTSEIVSNFMDSATKNYGICFIKNKKVPVKGSDCEKLYFF